MEQFAEAIQIIKGLWTQEKVTFAGKYYRVFEAECQPRPDPLPPIMVGAFKPKMLRLTAQYADEWNVSSTGIRKYADEMQQAIRELDLKNPCGWIVDLRRNVGGNRWVRCWLGWARSSVMGSWALLSIQMAR